MSFKTISYIYIKRDLLYYLKLEENQLTDRISIYWSNWHLKKVGSNNKWLEYRIGFWKKLDRIINDLGIAYVITNCIVVCFNKAVYCFERKVLTKSTREKVDKLDAKLKGTTGWVEGFFMSWHYRIELLARLLLIELQNNWRKRSELMIENAGSLLRFCK